jgi:hypothetical protein
MVYLNGILMDIVWDIVSKCNMNVDINVDIVWDVRHINGRFMRYQWDEKIGDILE